MFFVYSIGVTQHWEWPTVGKPLRFSSLLLLSEEYEPGTYLTARRRAVCPLSKATPL
jgi:hypothetical protein